MIDISRAIPIVRPRTAPLVVTVIVLLSAVVPVAAQNDDPVLKLLVDPTFETTTEAPAGLQPSFDRDAEAWLNRAKEAAGREDWKLVADTLERVIREHGHALVRLDDGSFRSAIEVAQMQIADLPEDGLAAYRILFDPTARRLLTEAKETHSAGPLREIARTYPMTTPGPEAIDLLTVWLLDDVRPGEAMALLDRLERLPHRQTPIADIQIRRAVAYALLRRSDRAERLLEEIRAGNKDDAELLAWVDAVSAFCSEATAQSIDVRALRSPWADRLGPTAAGLAAGLDPLVQPGTANVQLLPTKDKADPRVLREVGLSQGRPPVWQVVSDGERLFVSCPAGLVALDSGTFDVLWRNLPPVATTDPQIQNHRLRIQGFGNTFEMGGLENEERLDDFSTTALFREQCGAVSTAHGLVFILNQQMFGAERNPTRAGQPVPQEYEPGIGTTNALVAYDAESGLLKWKRGSGGPIDHGLTDAQFYSTPIAYGDNLLVTFVRNGDLFLGELSRDGDVVREVPIGSGSEVHFPMYGLLEPTIADGSVYVPSGAGLLMTLNEHDLSLRWIARYDRSAVGSVYDWRRPGALSNQLIYIAQDEWLSTPPIAAGGLVLLAPQDADHLFAFDIESGKQVWKIDRGAYRYIVGATDDCVVLAGAGVGAFKLEDGSQLWNYRFGDPFATSANRPQRSADMMKPSGRPLVFKDRVLMPTFNGMVSIDLQTGEPDPEPIGEGLTFGNLRAFDGALYSVDYTSIAKYPDPVQAEGFALEKLKRDPRDVPALLRLAWLSILRSDWAKALDRLTEADAAIDILIAAVDADDANRRTTLSDLRERVSHHRVSVLISMSDEADDDARSDLLTRAYTSAMLPADRAVAGLALAGHLFSTGDELGATSLCVRLIEQAGGRSIQMDDHWRIQDTIEVGRRLRSFYDRCGSETRAATDRAIGEAAEALRANRDSAGLRRLADAIGFMPLGAALDVDIAELAITDGYSESAIHFLQRAIARTESPALRQSALLRLLRLYASPPAGIPINATAARRIIAALEAEPAGTPLGTIAPELAASFGVGTIGEAVSSLQSSFPKEPADGLPAILRESGQLSLMVESTTPITGTDDTAPNVACFWDRDAPADVFAPVVPVFIANQFRGISAEATEENLNRWMNDPNFLAPTPAEEMVRSRPRAMAVAERIAVVVGPTQIDAFGLDTGRTMWTPIPITRHLGPLPNPPVLDAGGIVIAATDPNTLVAAAARDGAEPLWRRTWPDRHIGLMRIVDDRLVCVDRAAQRAAVVEIETGLQLREYDIPVQGADDSPAPKDEDRVAAAEVWPERRLAICGSFLLHAGRRHLVARRAATGELAWSADMDHEIRGVADLGMGYAAIYSGTNSVRVVTVDDGARVSEFKANGLEMPPIDAVVDLPRGAATPRLLLFTKLDELRVQYVLESYSLDSPEPVWRAEVGSTDQKIATITPQMLRASPDYVAIVTNDATAIEGINAAGQAKAGIDRNVPPQLYVISKATRRRVGPAPYAFAEGRLGGRPDEFEQRPNDNLNPPFHRSREISDVIILDRRIIAFAPEGFFVLADADDVRRAKSAP